MSSEFDNTGDNLSEEEKDALLKFKDSAEYMHEFSLAPPSTEGIPFVVDYNYTTLKPDDLEYEMAIRGLVRRRVAAYGKLTPEEEDLIWRHFENYYRMNPELTVHNDLLRQFERYERRHRKE